MSKKSFFTKLFDGTYTRSFLGVKLYTNLNVSSYDNSEMKYPEGIAQIDSVFRNTDKWLSEFDVTRREIKKIDLTLSADGYTFLFQGGGTTNFNTAIFELKWREYFGDTPFREATTPAWSINIVPFIPGIGQDDGARGGTLQFGVPWISAVVTIERN